MERPVVVATQFSSYELSKTLRGSLLGVNDDFIALSELGSLMLKMVKDSHS